MLRLLVGLLRHVQCPHAQLLGVRRVSLRGVPRPEERHKTRHASQWRVARMRLEPLPVLRYMAMRGVHLRAGIGRYAYKGGPQAHVG